MRTYLASLALLLAPIASSFALTPNLPAGIVTSQLTVITRVGTFEKAIRYAPKPVVPPYGKHLRGRGVFLVDINVMTGFPRDVRILTSTGSDLLDDVTTNALQKWQFQPHTVYKVSVPVEFHAGHVRVGR